MSLTIWSVFNFLQMDSEPNVRVSSWRIFLGAVDGWWGRSTPLNSCYTFSHVACSVSLLVRVSLACGE